jgi:hypothetical protein
MCWSRYQIDLVEELTAGQLDVAFRVARRVVKFLDLVMLAVPKRSARGKRRRRRHENNHLGAVLLLRSQDRDNTAWPPIGQPDAHGPDFDLFAVGQIA